MDEELKRIEFEELLGLDLSDWQWRWIDLIVNQGHTLERDGSYFVLTPRRK